MAAVPVPSTGAATGSPTRSFAPTRVHGHRPRPFLAPRRFRGSSFRLTAEARQAFQSRSWPVPAPNGFRRAARSSRHPPALRRPVPPACRSRPFVAIRSRPGASRSKTGKGARRPEPVPSMPPAAPRVRRSPPGCSASRLPQPVPRVAGTRERARQRLGAGARKPVALHARRAVSERSPTGSLRLPVPVPQVLPKAVRRRFSRMVRAMQRVVRRSAGGERTATVAAAQALPPAERRRRQSVRRARRPEERVLAPQRRDSGLLGWAKTRDRRRRTGRPVAGSRAAGGSAAWRPPRSPHGAAAAARWASDAPPRPDRDGRDHRPVRRARPDADRAVA